MEGVTVSDMEGVTSTREGVTVCTYNVHSFYDEEGRCRVEDIAAMFNQLKPDVICLQVTGVDLTDDAKLALQRWQVG